MHGRDLEAQVRAELEQIMPLVSALTGLPTRWSGVVELVEAADFKGKKRFTCDIQLAAELAEQDIRWTTLIHESLHAHSVGYKLEAYQALRGWEEAVVEQLQRILRSSILTQMGVSLVREMLEDLDARHPYNRYIQAMEAVRHALGVSEIPFYLDLLATPLAGRPPKMFMQVRQLPAPRQRTALEIISASNASLKRPL